MRQKKQPGWNGGVITINVVTGRRMEFHDNGSGLNEEEIHRFLAVIGQSSKTQLVNGQIPEDYIGRFGIGLLSCFMVSDSIVVHTVPADGSQAHVWTGLPDGTYTLEFGLIISRKKKLQNLPGITGLHFQYLYIYLEILKGLTMCLPIFQV